jgi:serine/threonine protein kinase/Tfp pilus assembly protein PilF
MMIGQTVSHYRILSKLGEGGMGVVYAAEDMHLGRRVAIKFLNATSSDHHYRARFLREARAISSLSHPYIATVFDYGETPEGQPFLVMELIEGETLGELLEASALTLWQSVEIIEHVAEALEEAHQRGIVHRDIKPSNVVVTERGQVKVLDFGLAKRMNEENHEETDPNAKTLLATHTRDGVVVGTPLYLSPEQATGAEVDGRSDVFALGALLYECISGKPAFSGSSVIEIGGQVLHVDPLPPSHINSHVPPELDRITLKALAKKPAERYQTAREMQQELSAARATLSITGQKIARIAPPKRNGQRTSALLTLTTSLRRKRISLFTLVIATIGIALLITGIAWLFRPKPHVPPTEAVKYYDTGTNFLREGAYYQASKSLERAVGVDDLFVLAHARLAEAYTELDYGDKAKDELLRVNALVPDRSMLSETDRLYLDAINATVVSNYPRAAESYLRIAQETPDKPEVYVDLGRAYERNDEVDKALESYVKAIERDGQYATAYLRAGILYIRKQNFDTAAQTLDKASSLYETLGNIEGRTETLYWRGVLLTEMGKFTEAREILQQAYDLAKTTGNESQMISALLQQSRVSYNEGEGARARDYANQALSFAELRGLNNLAILALLDLGSSLNTSGKYEEAKEHFKRARELSQRIRAPRLEALSKLNLGSALMQQLRTDEGVPLVEEALVFFQQGNYQKYILFCLSQLGRAHRRKGDYESALQAFQKNLQVAEASGYKREIAFAHGEIATAFAKQERYPEALRSYDQSLAINKELHARQSLAYNWMNRGSVLWQLGRDEEARASLDEAEKQAQADKPEDRIEAVLAEIEMIRAQIALSEGHFPEAKERSQRASAQAERFPDVLIGAKITLGLAQAFSGAAREGKRTCEEALALAEITGENALISDAMLALAQALYESGDAASAATRAMQVQERLARSGEQESEWRAWLVAVRSSQRKGDGATAREQLKRANDSFTRLQEQWGAEAFGRYQSRPDIDVLRKRLSGEVTAAL